MPDLLDSMLDGLTIEQFEKLPFEEAIDWLKNKVSMPTDAWDQLWQEFQDYAFTIAGVTRAELLDDIQSQLVKAMEDGTGIHQWKRDFKKLAAEQGWTPDPKAFAPWRVELILQQNLRNAYAAGRWQQINDPVVAKNRPYLQWRHRDSVNPRPAHKALHNKVFPLSDPLWSVCFPPNGFGCFAEGTEVATPQGWRAIESIREGDLVVGGSGNVQPVTAIHSIPYSGEVVRVVCNGIGETLATPNHRLLTLRGWIRADSLTKEDVLVQVRKFPVVNIAIDDVKQINSSTRDTRYSRPIKGSSANRKAFDPNLQRGNINIDPIRFDVMVMNNLKAHILQMGNHHQFSSRRFNFCIRMLGGIRSKAFDASLRYLFHNFGALCRRRCFQLFSNLPNSFICFLRFAQSRMSSLSRHLSCVFTHDLSGQLSPLRVVNPLRLDSLGRVSNFDAEMFQDLGRTSVVDLPAIAQLSSRYQVFNVESKCNGGKFLDSAIFNSANLLQQFGTDATFGSLTSVYGKVLHHATDKANRDTPSISDRLRRHLLLDVEEPQGFTEGHPLSAFDSLSDFAAFAKKHLILLPISRLGKDRYSGTVHDLSVLHDASYVLHTGIVHNCKCSAFTVSDRELREMGIEAESFPAERVPIRDRLTGAEQQVPAVRDAKTGKLNPIVEPGFAWVPGTSPKDAPWIESAIARLPDYLQQYVKADVNFVEFAAKVSKRKTMPNCTPGKSWSCGWTCLPMSKKRCGSAMPLQATTYANYLTEQISPKLQSTVKADGGGSIDKINTSNPLVKKGLDAVDPKDLKTLDAALKESAKIKKLKQELEAIEKEYDKILDEMLDREPLEAFSLANKTEVGQKFLALQGQVTQEEAKQSAKAESAMSRIRKSLTKTTSREEAELLAAKSKFLKSASKEMSEDEVRGLLADFYQITGGRGSSSLKKIKLDDDRAYADEDGNLNVGKSKTKRERDVTFWHEMGHHVEFEDAEIQKQMVDWVKSRSTSKTQKTLNEIVDPSRKSKPFDDDEIAYPDKFIDPYVGKVYSDGATEVMSMGLQHFSSSSDMVSFYKKDKEHFLLTVGALQ